ncbi:MAG TPA: NAD(P)-dependent oxidoreductase [bacterium]|nr:NAD(P)-dependent oxidoreductase [bacterium]
MKIAFFELEGWEKNAIKSHFPKDDLIFSEKPLTTASPDDLSEVEVISPFIYSKIDDLVLAKAPNLKLISTRSTGYDHIDIEACKKRKVSVANVPHYGENTVAEHTFALILALARKLASSIEKVRRGDFNTNDLRGFDLKGKTIGVIGTGGIGSHVIRIAYGFEMKIVAYDAFPNKELAKKYEFEYMNLDNLLSQSDIITLHLPAIKETIHLINKHNVLKIKKGAYIINTARGALIETEVLLQTLKDGIIAGAGLDVFEGEAEIKEECELINCNTSKNLLRLNVANNILLKDPRVIATPHNAFNSQEAIERILNTTLENIEAIKRNEKYNLV